MRNIININENWKFTIKNESTTLNLPHTWNGIDGQDGGNDYYRGTGVYEKELSRSDLPEGDEIYIQLDGVNSSAALYFNGTQLALHHGGYSTFRARLDGISEVNTIRIEADNSPNDFVYPQQADFTFYGGIYRDVKLIGVNRKHFDLDYYGAPGIMVTPNINGEIEIKVFADGDVRLEIMDAGSVVGSAEVSGKNPSTIIKLENPHLWNGTADPYLYTARAILLDDGKEVDEISTRFGIRSIQFDAEKGFILNGKPYPLRGVSRHQDRPLIGNALLPEHHLEDIELICEMGANTVRLAHYQHSQYFYDLCDERGLVVWAEIPYISRHMPEGIANTKSQLTELICQCYNHPSIVVWGLSNEISMNSSDAGLVENHRQLNELAHTLDKTRPTVVAVLSMCSTDDEYVQISDIVCYNHYFGWYGGTVDMYGKWFDAFHEKYPDRIVGLSEYGCEALDWHTSNPEQGDYTEEYQAYYHEEVIKQIIDRPYLWATHVWNMFDFAADARAEGGENGMNHKGLVSFDRKYKKDSFYAYQAWLSDTPVLHICSKRYIDRVENKTVINAYSNQSTVELFVNGKSIAVQQKGKYPFFRFEIDNEGESIITAKAGELRDECKIRKVTTFNEAYRMKEESAVINWFEISTPTGYYSVNDTIGNILTTAKGRLAMLRIGAIMLTALKSDNNNNNANAGNKKKQKGLSIMGFSLNKALLKNGYDMVKGFTIKRAVSMLGGGKFTKEQILKMNSILNKVKKPVK